MLGPQKLSFLFSLFLHIFILLFVYLIGSYSRPQKPLMPKSIPLKMMPIKSKTQLKKQSKKDQKTVKKTPETVKKQPKKTLNKAKNPLKEAQKVEKNVKKLPDKKKMGEKKAPKKEEPVKPKEKPQEVEKKKVLDTKRPVEEKDDFLEVMRTIEDLPTETKEEMKMDEERKKIEPEPVDDQPIEEILSLSELDALRQQVSSCWRLPAGVRGAQDLVIRMRVTMNSDRTVQAVDLENTGAETKDPVFVVAYESAKRALFHPKCTPLKLPAEKFNQWQRFLIIFNPKEMIV